MRAEIYIFNNFQVLTLKNTVLKLTPEPQIKDFLTHLKIQWSMFYKRILEPRQSCWLCISSLSWISASSLVFLQPVQKQHLRQLQPQFKTIITAVLTNINNDYVSMPVDLNFLALQIHLTVWPYSQNNVCAYIVLHTISGNFENWHPWHLTLTLKSRNPVLPGWKEKNGLRNNKNCFFPWTQKQTYKEWLKTFSIPILQ